ncbi:hypothetical protein [Aliikangiella maris]|uniref:Uncharacterized protein n=2 Tax=Aliikangiella maris TaxID=3162458 RepID=A0ABV2BWM1_9GAMM
MSYSKLSTRQWLNIIIFCISFMFLIVVLIGKKFTESEIDPEIESRIELLPQTEHFSNMKEQTSAFVKSNGKEESDYVLQQIDFGDFFLYRRGKQWEINSSEFRQKVSPEEIERVAFKWFQLLGYPTIKVTDPNLFVGTTVLLYVQGQSQPLICKVKQTNDQFIFYIKLMSLGQVWQIDMNVTDGHSYFLF